MSVLENENALRQEVLVIGAAGLDIVGRPSVLPDPGSSIPARMRPSFGGVARNVAENLARLGLPARLITVVGKDRFGEQLLAHTAQAGVDVSAALRSSEFATASYLAVLNLDGELYFALDDMRILSQLKPATLRRMAPLFQSARLVFVDANLSPAALNTVFSMAKHQRVPVCADATSPTLAGRLRPHLDGLMLITANPHEAAVLAGIPPFPGDDIQAAAEAARCLIARGAEIAVIPMAELGVCYATSETSGHIPAIRTTILDPTGAGDALTGALLFGLLNDIPLDEAIRLGVSAASLTLRHEGTVYPELNLELLYDQLVI